MSTRTKLICGTAMALALAVLVLPRLARRIDSSFDPIWEKAARSEAQYREMTNAYRIASEMASDHPTRRLWEESRAALLEAGYLETREVRMRRSLAVKGGVNAFFAAFHARFPGVECSVRGAKTDKPVVVVTARKSDFGLFGAVERFVSQYDPGK